MRRVAVVGTGIAGLTAAYALRRTHRLDLFEANAHPGGHANTVTVGASALDTGFIVHNRKNYSTLVEILDELGVETAPSEMSFSVSCACGLEWSSRRPWRAGTRLLGEIARFLRTADRAETTGKTLEQFLRRERYSEHFCWHYLVPMTSAIWSTTPGNALDTPAAFVIDFFRNHGMLGFRRHAWRVIEGGSQRYVQAMLQAIDAPLHLGRPVQSIARGESGVSLRTSDGASHRFDAVIVATHAPDALVLLADPSADERRLLGAFRTTANEAALHRDVSLLPGRASNVSAWNYRSAICGAAGRAAAVTYDLTRLQRLPATDRWCVSLNRTDEIDPALLERAITYHHPQVTLASLAAAAELHALNGSRGTAFAGAWQGSGFHEDGAVSGIRAAAAIGLAP